MRMKQYFAIILYLLCTCAYAQTYSYHKDIAPIIQQHCYPCHLAGEVAPFALNGYKDVVKNLKQIKYVTQQRIMPPWKADPTYVHFANENVLTDKEIAAIQQWANEGAKEGQSEKNAIIAKPQASTPVMGTDYIDIKMPVKYNIPGDNEDRVIQFILPLTLDSDRIISNIDFFADNRKAIHHANYKIVRYNEKVLRKIKTVVQTYPPTVLGDEIYDEPFALEDILFYGGWLPGASPMHWEEGCGFNVTKKLFIQFKMHYAPSTIEQKDQSTLRIYFTNKKITHPVKFMNIGSFGGLTEPMPPLVLPPDSVKSFKVSYTLPDSIHLMYFVPHMHLLGKNFTAYAVKPDGDTIPIVRINDWDFNWQEFYKFSPPLTLYKGYTLRIDGTFDNRTSNPNNPHNPALWIKQGVMTYNEMLSMVMIHY